MVKTSIIRRRCRKCNILSSEPVCTCGNVFPNMFGIKKKKQSITEMNKPLMKFMREKVREYKNGGSSGFSKIDIIKRGIPITVLSGKEYHTDKIVEDANYGDPFSKDYTNEGATAYIGKTVVDIAHSELKRVADIDPENKTDRLDYLVFYYSPPSARLREVCKRNGKKPFHGYFHIFETGASIKAIRHEKHAEFAWKLESDFLGNKQTKKEWGDLAPKKDKPKK